MSDELFSKDTYENKLLVEGHDDKHFCTSLFRYHDIQNIEIQSKEGIEKLLQTLPTLLHSSGLQRIGIIVDADESIENRWQSLRNILLNNGYHNVPIKPDIQGTIIREEDKHTIGIWLMPDNQVPGMLEHFCSFLIPQDDILWPLANEALQQVISRDRRFAETQLIKAHIHTWLAWQKEPGKPLGLAITKRFLDPHAPNAQQFIYWLRQLFELETAILQRLK